MKLCSILFFCIYLSTFLTACGSDVSSKITNEPNSVEFNATPSTNTHYDGVEDFSELNRRNALDFFSSLQLLLSRIDQIWKLFAGGYASPSFLELTYSPALSMSRVIEWGEDGCSSGELINSVNRNLDSILESVHFNLIECELGQYKFTGFIKFIGADGGKVKGISFVELKADWGEDIFILNGEITKTSSGGLSSETMLISSQKLSKSYALKELSIEESGIKLNLFDDNKGFIKVSSSEKTRRLTFNGENLTTLEASYSNKIFFGTDGFYAEYDIELKNARDEKLFTRTDTINSLSRLYLKNTPPTINLNYSNTVDRTADTKIQASPWDKDDDFLTFHWEVLGVPSRCANSIHSNVVEKLEDQIINFNSTCYGNSYTIRHYADDGITKRSYMDAVIEVLPLPAKIKPIADLIASDTDTIEVQLVIENLKHDGPFEYRLSNAPNGLVINDTDGGRVTGHPRTFISNYQHEFNVGITVDNGRQSLVDFTITMSTKDQSKEKYRSKIFSSMDVCGNIENGWRSIDKTDALFSVCPFFQGYRVFKSEGGIISLHSYNRGFSEEQKLVAAGFSRFNKDSIDDIVLVYRDWIYIVDLLSQKVLQKIKNTVLKEAPQIGVIPMPSRHPGFAIRGYGLNADIAYYFDSEKETFSPVDTNSILLQLGKPPFNDRNTNDGLLGDKTQLLSIENPKNGELIDFDNDGDFELVNIFPPANDPGYVSIQVIDTNTQEIIFSQKEIFDTKTELRRTPQGSKLLNLDSDPEMEFILYDQQYTHEIYIYDLQNGEYKLVGNPPLPEECGYHSVMDFTQTPNANNAIIQNSFRGYFCELNLDKGFTIWSVNGPAFRVDNGVYDYFDLLQGTDILVRDDKSDSRTITVVNLDDNLEKLKTKMTEIPDFSYGQITPLFNANNHVESILILPELADTESEGILKVYETGFYSLVNTLSDFPGWEPADVKLYNGGINDNGNIITAAFENQLWAGGTGDEPSTLTSFHEIYRAENGVMIDIDHNGDPELIRLENTTRDEKGIALYRLLNGEFTRSYQALPHRDSYSIGIQDTDGDAALDIVVLRRPFSCSSSSLSDILVYSINLDLKFNTKVPGCVKSIPTINSEDSKINIIAVNETAYELDRFSSVSYFWEISPYNGAIIWKSRPFSGGFYDDNIIILGEGGLYDAEKMSLFGSGLNKFH